MGLFTIGCIVFAVANSMVVLIAGRLIQGLGAGGLDVLEEIILADITTLKERPLYLGAIAVAIATGSILGPIVGALFSEFSTWRWIGWVNLPIVGSAFVLAMCFLRLKPIQTPFCVKIKQLDWMGMVLLTVGATVTALPLSWADTMYPWSSWRTIVPLIIGLMTLLVFGIYERRPKNPVIPYRIFSNITAIVSLVTGLVHGLLLYTMLLYLPLFFQAVFLEAPLEAAKSTIPVCILAVVFSFIAPVTIEFTRCYRVLLWLGWIFTSVSFGLFCLVSHETSRVNTYLFQAMLGVGIGTVFTGTQIPMQASVIHVDDTGLAVGMLVVFRLGGALIGLSISSTAFSSVFQKGIAPLLPLPEQLALLEDASQAISFIPVLRTLTLTAESMSGVIEAYEKAFRAVWIILTSLSIFGLSVSFFMKDLSLETEEIGRQRFEN
ncbi:hypothetical protein HYALB_00004362 [Hymenoscyphus albidus]|uniref:Major facilitator superfamily (MFS) profile domain-containing protein n=1 Tax=Hymenoscyphus albidus TaxID=595503 RepID=A0A9N9Q5M5_9HELO|nr:hypothetical protein HYALB_00004362 [Hymenoscyphus albidus]